MKNIGPRILPRGTPKMTGFEIDRVIDTHFLISVDKVINKTS